MSDILKIGLIGCGGRGLGAAVDALTADPHTELYTVADVFPGRLHGVSGIRENFGARVTATPERCFEGFDAYQKLLATDVDVVLIAMPVPPAQQVVPKHSCYSLPVSLRTPRVTKRSITKKQYKNNYLKYQFIPE